MSDDDDDNDAQVAYSRMLFLQRQKLHRSIAERLEQLHGDNLAEIAPLLAHHWFQVLESQTEPEQALIDRAASFINLAIQQAQQNDQNASDLHQRLELLMKLRK